MRAFALDKSIRSSEGDEGENRTEQLQAAGSERTNRNRHECFSQFAQIEIVQFSEIHAESSFGIWFELNAPAAKLISRRKLEPQFSRLLDSERGKKSE